MIRLTLMKGFTVIELVIVIVLMSIVSLAGVEVIRQSSEAYASMSNRQSLGNSARLAVERMSRELRGALPGSARTNSNCLEFIPITVAGRYFTVPVESAAASMQVVPVSADLQSVTGRIAVYPVGSNVYDLTTNLLSPVAGFGASDGNNVSPLSWTGNHSFPYRSPTSRFFLVAQPVSFCIDGDYLFRYSNYGYAATQPDLSGLPTALPDRALLVDKVSGTVLPFQVTDPGLTRNAMVEMNLSFTGAGESFLLSHEAQLRNVP